MRQEARAGKAAPCGACFRCGHRVYGDGDIAQQTSDSAFICLVCFLDVDSMREVVERSGLFDMGYFDKLTESNRAFFDECRGREIRRRAVRDAAVQEAS